MSALANSLSAVTVILVLTASGYFCSAAGWIKPDVKTFLSRYLMRFAVPVMVAYSLRTYLTMDMLKESGVMLLIPAVSTVGIYLAGWAIGRALGLELKSQSVFAVMCSISNAMFIGYSMCKELFGESCTPYVMDYYLVNTSFVQLVCVPLIRRSAGHEKGSAKDMLLEFFTTPTIIGVLTGALLIITNWTPPDLVMTIARYINNTVTPLALLMAGHIIYEIGLKQIRVNKVMTIAMVCKFIVSPAISVALCALFGVTGLARSVLVVMSAMPVMTQTVVAAAEYGADEQLAAQGIALSTLACFVVIPVVMMLL